MIKFIDFLGNNNAIFLNEMSKIGTITVHGKKSYGVGCFMDEDHIGEPYFKIYDNLSYESSKNVMRFSMEGNYVIYHSNRGGKGDLILNDKTIKLLIKFMHNPCKFYSKYTNWDYTLYAQNKECGMLETFDKFIKIKKFEELRDCKNLNPKNILLFGSPMPIWDALAYKNGKHL